MKNAILIHGKNTDPSQIWYPWLKNAMDNENIPCAIPTMPNSNDPHLNEWLEVIDSLAPNNDTILIGHSRGGVAILRWLELQPENVKIDKCILVAANSGLNAHRTMKNETNYGFYSDNGYNFDTIKSHCGRFYVLHSRDDPWVPYEQGVENSTGLNARLYSYDGFKHFGVGIDRVPNLVRLITEPISP